MINITGKQLPLKITFLDIANMRYLLVRIDNLKMLTNQSQFKPSQLCDC